jgi:serine/threonine protein phosphatase PrpC
MSMVDDSEPTHVPTSNPLLASAGATHVGAVRKVNEDNFLCRPEAKLWLVADGVGGAAAGDWASLQVAEALAGFQPGTDAPTVLAEVRAALDHANTILRARVHRGERAAASTVVVLLVFGWHYTCLWAGDSRGYLRRDGRFAAITRDHSEVQELVDAGHITAEEALKHPRANVITRAVGAADTLSMDRVAGVLRPGDHFLLCTDGLTKMLPEPEIEAMVAMFDDDALLCQALIERAVALGADDNVTAVSMRCLRPGIAGRAAAGY